MANGWNADSILAESKLSKVIKDKHIQGGSNMTRTDLCVNKLHCAAAVRP
jgi:hypothetical protein